MIEIQGEAKSINTEQAVLPKEDLMGAISDLVVQNGLRFSQDTDGAYRIDEATGPKAEFNPNFVSEVTDSDGHKHMYVNDENARAFVKITESIRDSRPLVSVFRELMVKLPMSFLLVDEEDPARFEIVDDLRRVKGIKLSVLKRANQIVQKAPISRPEMIDFHRGGRMGFSEMEKKNFADFCKAVFTPPEE